MIASIGSRRLLLARLPDDIVIFQALDKLCLRGHNFELRKRKLGDIISVFQISVQWLQSANLRVENQRLGLSVEGKVAPVAATEAVSAKIATEMTVSVRFMRLLLYDRRG